MQALSVVFGARIKDGTLDVWWLEEEMKVLGIGNAVFDDLGAGSTSVFQFTDLYT